MHDRLEGLEEQIKRFEISEEYLEAKLMEYFELKYGFSDFTHVVIHDEGKEFFIL